MYGVQSSKSFLVGHRHIEIIGSSKERNKISNNISDKKYKQMFNKIQGESSFGRHVGGQEYTLQHGGQYKSYCFVEISKCHKMSPLNVFRLKFWV